jgi:hypothetical protein
MAKHNRAAKQQTLTQVPTAPLAATQPVVSVQNGVTSAPGSTNKTQYTVVAPKRPLTGLKYGASGNAYTHAQLANAAAASPTGTLTATQAMEVCIAANHVSFFTYAVKRLRILVPVEPQQ